MQNIQGSDALAEFHRNLAGYLVWAKKEQGPVIEDRGRKVRFELNRQFQKIAPTAAGVRAELEARGYALKRRMDGKLAAEYPNAAQVGAVPLVSPAEEIKLRIRSLKFLSVSFLYREWRSAPKEGQSSRFASRTRSSHQIGAAIVETKTGNESPFVELASNLVGAAVQNRERDIADKALLAQSADMALYIQRKHQEHLEKSFRKAYSVGLGVLS